MRCADVQLALPFILVALSASPGLAIILTVPGLNLPGDWLRDRVDLTGKR